MSALPVFLHSLQQEVEATDGDIVTFQVKVTGNPNPVVSWLQCGEPVYHVGGRREIIDHPDGWHELILTNITQYDDGEFECRAENKHGHCSCFTSLYYYEEEGRADSTTEGTVEGTSTDEQGDTRLLILIDDGSDTECEEDGSCRKSLSASEQIEGFFDGFNGNASTSTLSYDFNETTDESQFSEAREDESISPAQCPDQLVPELEDALNNVGSFHYVVKTPLEYADVSKGRSKKKSIIINADKASSDLLRGGRRTEVIGDHLNMSYSRSSYKSSSYRRTEGKEDYSSRSSRYEARRSSRDSESYLARSTRTRFSAEGDEDLSSYRRSTRLTSRDDDDDSSSWKRARLSGSYDVEETSASLSAKSARAAALSFGETVEGPNGKAREIYMAVMDFAPMECDIGAIPMKSGQEVEIIDSSKPRKWLVKTRPMKGCESQEGWVPTCYLEKKTMSMTDLSAYADTRTDPKEREAATRREAIVKELVETEEDFARDMQYVVDNYYLEMDNPRMPKELRDQRDLLFTNFKPICEFHNNVLIKGVQYHAKEPALLGKTFLRLERDFDMHVNYCRDEVHAQQLLTSGPLKVYFDEHSRRIGDDKILAEHLKLPIQRLNDYQLLLRELIKYTSRLKEDTADLQKALDFMECIPRRSEDLKYLNAMEGYRGSIHKLGRIVKHGWLEVIEPSKPKLERYVFLFKTHIFITEVIRISSSKDTYLVKNIIKLQNVEIIDKLTEDACSFKIQHKNKDQSGYPVLLRASSVEKKDTWVQELVSHSASEDLGEDEPVVASVSAGKLEIEEPEAKRTKVEREVENTESDVRSIEMEDECTDAKIPSLTSDIKIELPEEEGTTNITESLRSESASSLEDIDGNPKHNPSKPQFQKSLRGINCVQGEYASFECVVTATPTPTIKWLKNNKPITKSQRIKIAAQGNKYTLTIKEALPDDTGLYTVMASNPGGIASCSATLNVNQGMLGVPKEDSRPTTPGGTILPHQPIFKVKLKDTELLEGTSVRFELVVRGDPQPKVTL